VNSNNAHDHASDFARMSSSVAPEQTPIFFNTYKAYDDFKHESSVSSWLYRIVLNASKKYNRESRKLPVAEYAEQNNLSQAVVGLTLGAINTTGCG